MGAYEDIPIIRDKSAEIYGQLGNIVGTGVASALDFANKFKYDERIKYEDEVKKRNKEIGAAEARVRMSQTKEMMREFNILRETDVGLADQYLAKMKGRMNGVGKEGDEDYVLGTIDAETKLITDTDLSSEEKTYLSEYVINTQAYAKNNTTIAAALQTDGIEQKQAQTGDYGPQFQWDGKNELDRFTAQAVYSAMMNNGNVGYTVDPTQTVYTNTIGENGDAVIDVQFAMPKEAFENTAAYKLILANATEETIIHYQKRSEKEDYGQFVYKKYLEDNLPELKDGHYIFKFKGDQNSMKNGLTIDLGEAADTSQPWIKDGLVDEKGFTEKAFIGKFDPYVSITDGTGELTGRQKIGIRKFFDMNEFDQVDFAGLAGGVLGNFNKQHVQRILNARYGITDPEARRIIEGNDSDELGRRIKEQAQETLFAKMENNYIEGKDLSAGERTYLENNGVTIGENQKYYFEGKDPTLVNKPSSDGKGDSSAQFAEDIQRRGRIKLSKEKLDHGLESYEGDPIYKKQIEKDQEYLNSFDGIQTMTKEQAIASMEHELIAHPKAKDSNGDLINTQANIDRMKKSNIQLWLVDGNKTTALTSYDPLKRDGGMLSIIAKRVKVSSKTSENLNLRASQLSGGFDPLNPN